MTSYPSAEKIRAIASPIPEDAPVTKACIGRCYHSRAILPLGAALLPSTRVECGVALDRRQPCLFHQPDPESAPVRVSVDRRPFRIGRSAEADLILQSPRVSKLHAEIDKRGDGFLVRDLGSRNGTFVNGERIEGEHMLAADDVIHIASRELRFVLEEAAPDSVDDSTLASDDLDHAGAAYHRGTRDLYRILRGRAVHAVFQAIVDLGDLRVVGYEALGRNSLPNLSYPATELFRLAHERGKADELSRIMRTAALEDAPALPASGERLFMNVHPAEMRNNAFLRELARSAEVLGGGRLLVAEIHESAVADATSMRRIRAELRAMSVELAYDDFGAGQSRLMELAEVPPDCLKIDMGLIRAIDQ
ncbi:MAG: EAL domain-containing protein, partial [Sandaracinaceae bacterium]|nr:EAL domain-containing protein [Sandaracinaceae bacterium]